MSPRTQSRSDRAPKLGPKGRVIIKALGDEELDGNQLSEKIEALGWHINPRGLPQYIRHHLEGEYIEVTRVYGQTSRRPLNKFKAIPRV